jgi:hypothetical protein
MTEAEWLACTDPTPMLADLPPATGERKLRLYAVACCRRIWDRLPEEDCRRAVDAIERAADDPNAADDQYEAMTALQEGYGRVHGLGEGPRGAYLAACVAAFYDPLEAARMSADAAAIAVAGDNAGPAWEAERRAQAAVLRCLLARPSGSAAAPGQLTSTAVTLARCIYAERAFDRLPILADALEDAGCDDADILSHCRGDGPHVRGCWVVDLILGKE